MASILSFSRREKPAAAPAATVSALVEGFSMEVMPRTAAKVDDFRAILPAGTRIYIAHIDGTQFEEMQATAARLVGEGFRVMPHIPARLVPDRASLDRWVSAYADLGITEALLLGGGLSEPRGEFHSSMQLMETGIFDARGFRRLHVAGHPEGNRDIDTDGGERIVMEALRWKQDFAERTGAEMAIVTQFVFEAAPVVRWAERLNAAGIGLPVHVGIAGPAKLQTMIKFAMACGVGPSLRVLQRRAKDVTKLLMPFTPHELLADLAAEPLTRPGGPIAGVHFFPLGGIAQAAACAAELTDTASRKEMQ